MFRHSRFGDIWQRWSTGQRQTHSFAGAARSLFRPTKLPELDSHKGAKTQRSI
jgi:hypothetical protein